MAQFKTVLVSKNHPAVRLGRAADGQKVHMQVVNAGVTLHFASERDTLETDNPFGGQGGYTIDSTSGLIEIQWTGEIFALGDSANAADVQLRFGVE